MSRSSSEVLERGLGALELFVRNDLLEPVKFIKINSGSASGQIGPFQSFSSETISVMFALKALCFATYSGRA